LTPLLVPLTMLCCSWLALARIDDTVQQWRASLLVRWLLWLLFNAVLVLLFGVAHQGGVVRALAHLYETAAASSAVGSTSTVSAGASDGATTVLFYATYTPPLHLLLQSDARWARDERLQGSLVSNTYELYSVPRGKLHAALDSHRGALRHAGAGAQRGAGERAEQPARCSSWRRDPRSTVSLLVAPSNGASDTLGALRSLAGADQRDARRRSWPAAAATDRRRPSDTKRSWRSSTSSW
jgi:hypothetical protein